MTRAKPAAQSRSQDKHQRILRAMESLLEQRPFETISIGDIAAAADISPATIYQRFRNRDAAGAILLELYFQRVQDWAARPKGRCETAAGKSLEAALKIIAEDAWEQIAALGHIMRPAYLYSRQKPDLAGTEWAELKAMALRGFRAFLEQHAKEITLANLDNAAATVAFAVNMMVTGKLLHGEEAPDPLLTDKDTFAREVAALAYRYLTPPKGGAI